MDSHVQALEQELARVRRDHIAHLREIAAAAGIREAFAVSLLASLKGEGKDTYSDEPNGGPGTSPGSTAANDKGSAAPPTGADPSPHAGKLNRWLSRSKPAKSKNDEGSSEDGSKSDEGRGKLDRWLSRVGKKSESIDEAQSPGSDRSQGTAHSTTSEPAGGASSGGGKLGRWLARASNAPTSCPAAHTSSGAWEQRTPCDRGDRADISCSHETEELMSRIRHAFTAVDTALAFPAAVTKEHTTEATRSNSSPTLCAQCGGEVSSQRADVAEGDPPRGANNSSMMQSPQQQQQQQQQPRGMGMRVEETHKGLTVTHVVPGGQGEKGGLQVLDLIKTVDGKQVARLKDLGERVKACTTGEICFEISRGKGASKMTHKLCVTLGGGDSSPMEGVGRDNDASNSEGSKEAETGSMLLGADVLLQTFLKARREDKGDSTKVGDERSSPESKIDGRPAWRGDGRGGKRVQKFNKYGKDTQLWVPASDDAANEIPSGTDPSKFPKQAEAGGFFMFPPGHPDYVPLPPGEAALIAGRSDVHPQERLAPHWSHIIFQAPSGAEIRAQARHATYGSIEQVSGKLVPADPITAHSHLTNASQVCGSVVYVKRGGAPFTKKARVAVASGAVACVVANSDRETFGMSYTDDGLPFDALNIPCVMISSDIASKLEVSDQWSVTLVPARPDQQGTKKPPQNQPKLPGEEGSDSNAIGMCSVGRTDGEKKLIPALKGLEGLPISLKPGVHIGRPGKKPTMWKKIKLLLP